MNREDIKGMMKELDKRKVMEPGGVSGCILKKCRQEMAESIYDKTYWSLKTKIPKKWKC